MLQQLLQAAPQQARRVAVRLRLDHDLPEDTPMSAAGRRTGVSSCLNHSLSEGTLASAAGWRTAVSLCLGHSLSEDTDTASDAGWSRSSAAHGAWATSALLQHQSQDRERNC